MQTDKGIVLATRLVEMLRERRILLPVLSAVERVCAEAVTRANRRIYKQLTSGADGSSSWTAGPAARSQAGQQHDVAWLAAAVTTQAELQAHAGAY